MLILQYPCYSISTWSALWSNWKGRKQRFANIPLDVGARSALANGQNDGAMSDHRQGGSGGHTTGEAADAGEDLSAAELEAIFGNEALQNVSFADRMAIYQAQVSVLGCIAAHIRQHDPAVKNVQRSGLTVPDARAAILRRQRAICRLPERSRYFPGSGTAA
jgi:hypothetical protein